MSSIQRLGYLGFNVTDLSAWRSYATDTLGLMEASATPDKVLFRGDSRTWRIAVHQSDSDDIAYAGFEVANEVALNDAIAHLRSAGIKVTVDTEDLAKDRGVMGLAYCFDPSGVQIEIYYGASELFEKAFVSPAGVSGFEIGDQGLGHYVLSVADLDESLDFYVNGLGFELSDVIDWNLRPDVTVQVQFFHCNRRHHTLALVNMPASKKLHHFMLQVSALDDVGRAYDRVDAANAVVMTFGRHTNDHMYSFYGATPSGFAVEYGWGAREVDSDWSVVRYDKISMWGHKFVQPPA